jgi:hypothetical protein
MQASELGQLVFAPAGRHQSLTAGVAWIGAALQQAGSNCPVHQFDNRVVLEPQRIGDLPDGGGPIPVSALDRQEQLVLGGGQADGSYRLVGEVKKGPKGYPESGQGAVLGGGHRPRQRSASSASCRQLISNLFTLAESLTELN